LLAILLNLIYSKLRKLGI